MDFDYGIFDFEKENITDFSSLEGFNDACCWTNDTEWKFPKFQQPLFKIEKNSEVKQSPRAKKSFKCEECNKEYKSKENYLLHYSNKHLKQKPYKCRFCSIRYSHRNGRRYHEKNYHHETTAFSCCSQLTHLSNLVSV